MYYIDTFLHVTTVYLSYIKTKLKVIKIDLHKLIVVYVFLSSHDDESRCHNIHQTHWILKSIVCVVEFFHYICGYGCAAWGFITKTIVALFLLIFFLIPDERNELFCNSFLLFHTHFQIKFFIIKNTVISCGSRVYGWMFMYDTHISSIYSPYL